MNTKTMEVGCATNVNGTRPAGRHLIEACARELIARWPDMQAEADQVAQIQQHPEAGEHEMQLMVVSILRRHFSVCMFPMGAATQHMKGYVCDDCGGDISGTREKSHCVQCGREFGSSYSKRKDHQT